MEIITKYDTYFIKKVKVSKLHPPDNFCSKSALFIG